MRLEKQLYFVFYLASSISAHPLDFRVLVRGVSTTTVEAASVTAPAVTLAPSTVAPGASHNLTLHDLFDGNKKFRAQPELSKNVSETPRVMFIGCSDNKFSPDLIFEAPTGSITSQLNVANQFSGKDTNTNAIIAYAVHNLGIKHIVVMGHYGCKGVHAVLSPRPKSIDNIVHTWLKPVQDIFSGSKRVEIKRLRDSRKEKREGAEAEAEEPAFRALVEENIKESVKRLVHESALSSIFRRKKNGKEKDVELHVHGFVFNEADGEVKDLDVTFSSFGQTTPDVPFEKAPKAKEHTRWGKWKAKTKKRPSP